jgi:hypothetical protein
VSFSAAEVKKCLPTFLNLALTTALQARNAGMWYFGHLFIPTKSLKLPQVLQSEEQGFLCIKDRAGPLLPAPPGFAAFWRGCRRTPRRS